MINRMVDPTSGTIEIDGEDISRVEPVRLRRGIGYVMQNSGLLPHRRVIDNIATVPRLTGVPKEQAHQRALELMDVVGLDRAFARRYPNQLSGGQQQRVAGTRTRGRPQDPAHGRAVRRPRLVRSDLQQEELTAARARKTILFVTHDIDEAILLADQVVILESGGRIFKTGTPEEILAAPANDFVATFVGADRGKRALTRKRVGSSTVLIHGDGHAAGVLAP